MEREVFFEKKENYSEIAVVDDGILQFFYHLDNEFHTGDIFVGKVRFVKKQVGIFVDVGMAKDGLLPFREGVRPGDAIIVQVSKEPTDEKGCALTEKITLAGRFAVLNDVGEYKFSHKLSEGKKVALFGVPQKEGIGFIFRSSCEYVDKGVVFSECAELAEKYENILKSGRNVTKVICLYKEDAEKVARRFSFSDDRFKTGFDEIKDQIRGLTGRKVYADSVELVFDKTEAMTVVDVNLHKFGETCPDIETANVRANLIAVRELARQLRLRNVGGIIMVDVISMREKSNYELVKNALLDELKKDNVKTKVELVESIGMFAIVRKRRYASL